MKNEIWKDLNVDLYYRGIKNCYQVSNMGRVRNKVTGHIMTPRKGQTSKASARVTLEGAVDHALTFNVSTLVWKTFATNCREIENVTISFKDGNPMNCKLSNLYIEPTRFTR
jgi:hypothetical protein